MKQPMAANQPPGDFASVITTIGADTQRGMKSFFRYAWALLSSRNIVRHLIDCPAMGNQSAVQRHAGGEGRMSAMENERTLRLTETVHGAG